MDESVRASACGAGEMRESKVLGARQVRVLNFQTMQRDRVPTESGRRSASRARGATLVQRTFLIACDEEPPRSLSVTMAAVASSDVVGPVFFLVGGMVVVVGESACCSIVCFS